MNVAKSLTIMEEIQMNKQKIGNVFGILFFGVALTACGQAAMPAEAVLPLAQVSLDEVKLTPTATRAYEAQAVITNHSDEDFSYVNYQFEVDGELVVFELPDGIAARETQTTAVNRGPSSGDVDAMKLLGVNVAGFEDGIAVTMIQDYVSGQTTTIKNSSQISELDDSSDAPVIEPVRYEVVAENDLPTHVQAWVSRFGNEPGTDGFNDRDGGWTYLLISAGETTSTTAEIKLHGFERQGDSSLITYEVVNEGNESGAVQAPKLIVRVPLQEGWRTDFKQIDSQGETVESKE